MRFNGFATVSVGIALFLTGLSCSKTPASVTVSPAKVEICDIGGSAQLAVTVKDKDGKPIEKAAVTYASANAKVAEVEADGHVNALASGDTEITVTAGPVSTKVPVRVRLITSLQLAMAREGETLAAGILNGTYPLKVTGFDEARNPADLSRATWKSSAPAVAAVDSAGVLTLLSTGKTEISVQMGKTVAKLLVPVEILIPMAIKLDAPTFSVKSGESAPLPYAVVSDRGTILTISPTFTSSAPDVVAVDDKGVVTGGKRGAAQVKIQTGAAVNTITVTVR